MDRRECQECGKETSNPKFCSRACSVTRANRATPKRKRTYDRLEFCLVCDFKLTHTHRAQKFCSQACSTAHQAQEKVQQWLLTGVASAQVNCAAIRGYILDEQGGTCAICGLPPQWRGKPLKFVLDHIDGNSSDSSRANLRLVCHNCDSQLDTYKSRNIGKGRHSRRERYALGMSY